MKKLLMIIPIVLTLNQITWAQTNIENLQSPSPYGDYESSKKRGRYGKPFVVNNKEEAIDIIKSYYRDRKIKIGEVEERRRFFIIEVLDEQNSLIDVIVVNKKNGRFRSIY
ncbi:MAG: hypothetical protein N2202_06900 [Proteobacteria bacterium]|nr:hypothetical protein [Pseudomonadota bacterium]